MNFRKLSSVPILRGLALGASTRVWILLLLWVAYSFAVMAWHVWHSPNWMDSICWTR